MRRSRPLNDLVRNDKFGSPRGPRIRTFSLTFIFGLSNTRQNKRFPLFYCLENERVHIGPPLPEPGKKPVKNPLELAILYQKILKSQYISKADLARKIGVSRTRIIQILNLLNLDDAILKYLKSAKYPEGNGIPERQLRSLTKIKSHKLQRKKFRELVGKKTSFAGR